MKNPKFCSAWEFVPITINPQQDEQPRCYNDDDHEDRARLLAIQISSRPRPTPAS
jgi:hypothetical protein